MAVGARPQLSRGHDASNLVSLRPLQQLSATLREVAAGRHPDPRYRRRACRFLRAAGDTCLPLLVRGLRGGDAPTVGFCYFLLARLGTRRAAEQVARLLADPDVADDVKTMALALLTELRAQGRVEITMRDPEGTIGQSVRELVSRLSSSVDEQMAADLVAAQVPSGQLILFCEEILRHGGPRARRLVHTIANRQTDSELRELLFALTSQKGGGIPPPLSGCAEAPSAIAQESELTRGLHLLDSGDARRASRRLRRYVRERPEDPVGRAALGVCLVQLGKSDSAVEHLEQACICDPKDALNFWNLAAAARQAGRSGRCYLALRAYLVLRDAEPGGDERRAEATAFTDDYDRLASAAYPGVLPPEVARADELLVESRRALAAGRFRKAAATLEALLLVVPGHRRAWVALADAYRGLGMAEQESRSIAQARHLANTNEPARTAFEDFASGDRQSPD